MPCVNLPLRSPLLVCRAGINRKGCCWLCLEELSRPFCPAPVTPSGAARAPGSLSAPPVCAVRAPQRSRSGSLQTPRAWGGWSQRDRACQQNWMCHLMSAEAPREAGLCYFREGFSGIKCRNILVLYLWGRQELPAMGFCSVSLVHLILQSRLGHRTP